MSDFDDDATDRLCLNCWITSGAVVERDCCPMTIAANGQFGMRYQVEDGGSHLALKLVSVTLEALGFALPTLYLGFCIEQSGCSS